MGAWLNRGSITLLLAVSGLAFLYGVAVGRFEIFPYKLASNLLHMAQNVVVEDRTYGPWSICRYGGPSPFELHPVNDVQCPLLDRNATESIGGKFIGDPFFFRSGGQGFVFFEVLNRDTKLGEIAYATVASDGSLNAQSTVLAEPFHLSYPQVFEWQGSIYMVPESHADLSVRLYEATDFPSRWALRAKLLSGFGVTDPTLFRHDGLWWMLATAGNRNDVLNLFYSEELAAGWQPHPQNPIVRKDRKLARSAGPVFRHDGKLYRLAQDGSEYYGKQVWAMEITSLTIDSYAERLAHPKPLLGPSGDGWNRVGMHHLDLHETGAGWEAYVDGKRFK